jgi:hypothetical protein
VRVWPDGRGAGLAGTLPDDRRVETNAMTSLVRVIAVAGVGLGLALQGCGKTTPAAKPVEAAATPAAAAAPAKPQIEPEALAAVKRMSDYLGTLKTFQVNTQTNLDLVTEEGQRVQVDGQADYKVRRPDGFVIDVKSDLKDRRFIYDGKTFTVFAPKLGYYATVDAPKTIQATLDEVSDKLGIQLPLEDLFTWSDPQAHRAERVTSAYYIGPAMIDGVDTDHYAFREKDLDWEIWIQTGDQPLPRKLAIVDKRDPAMPGYTARLTWNTRPALTPATFTFKPGADAKRIRIAAAQ